MTETPARKPRPRRTFSAFGDVRKMPSEYEIVTHAQNWTLRQNRAAAFEQNPSSAANLWFLTYRDNSPLQAEDWDAYRDPDALTYKAYVNLQSDAETKVQGVLEAHADAAADAALTAGSVALLGHAVHPVALPVPRLPAGAGLHRLHGAQFLHHQRGRLRHRGFPPPGDHHRLPDQGTAARPAGLGHRLGRAVAVGGSRRLAAGPQGRRVRTGQLRLGRGVHRPQPRPRRRPWTTCC